MDQPDFPGDTIGYINFAPFLIGTPVIDTYYLKLAGPSIYNADHGPKRQVRVGRRQSLSIEDLAIGGLAAIEAGTIPAGVTQPGFERLHRSVQMCNQGSLHHRSDEEHERYPPDCSPDHEESMSHSVFFVLLGSRKV